jgi:signal transduction histidine kinase
MSPAESARVSAAEPLVAGPPPPSGAERESHYERAERSGMTMLRNARLAGVQTLIATAGAAAIMPLAPPTDPIGDAGWALAGAIIAIGLAVGIWLLRTRELKPDVHLALLYLAIASVSAINWLAGGLDSPYSLFYAQTVQQIAIHPLRRALPFVCLMLASVCLPLAYGELQAATAATIIALVPALLALALSVSFYGRNFYVDLERRRLDTTTARVDAEHARRAAESARASAQRLRELDQMKEGFVSTVSHELRSPLTSVKGYLEAMLEGEAGELTAEQREYAEIVYRNSGRLQALVDDLLLLSRIEAGKLVFEQREFDLVAILEQLAAGARPALGEHGSAVEVRAPAELAMTGDPRRLERAVGNLVTNAVLYSPDGGDVLLTARLDDGEVVIEVIDHGQGIPVAEIDQLGTRFFRGSGAGTAPGSGLGLAITRALAEGHGGRLEIESAFGEGSTFRIIVPREGTE